MVLNRYFVKLIIMLKGCNRYSQCGGGNRDAREHEHRAQHLQHEIAVIHTTVFKYRRKKSAQTASHRYRQRRKRFTDFLLKYSALLMRLLRV